MSHYDPNALGATRPSHYSSDTGFKGGKYLPMLKLCAGLSNAVGEGKALPGTFGYAPTKETWHNFGTTIDVLIYAAKNLAIDLSIPGETARWNDPTSSEYKAVEAKAENDKRKYLFGTVFLLYERTLGIPLEYFCGNQSSRIEVPGIESFLPLGKDEIAARQAAGQDVSDLSPHWAIPCSLTGTLIKTKNTKFHVPKPSKCAVPFANQPTMEEVQALVKKFLASDEIDAPEGSEIAR